MRPRRRVSPAFDDLGLGSRYVEPGDLAAADFGAALAAPEEGLPEIAERWMIAVCCVSGVYDSSTPSRSTNLNFMCPSSTVSPLFSSVLAYCSPLTSTPFALLRSMIL